MKWNFWRECVARTGVHCSSHQGQLSLSARLNVGYVAICDGARDLIQIFEEEFKFRSESDASHGICERVCRPPFFQVPVSQQGQPQQYFHKSSTYQNSSGWKSAPRTIATCKLDYRQLLHFSSLCRSKQKASQFCISYLTQMGNSQNAVVTLITLSISWPKGARLFVPNCSYDKSFSTQPSKFLRQRIPLAMAIITFPPTLASRCSWIVVPMSSKCSKAGLFKEDAFFLRQRRFQAPIFLSQENTGRELWLCSWNVCMDCIQCLSHKRLHSYTHQSH